MATDYGMGTVNKYGQLVDLRGFAYKNARVSLKQRMIVKALPGCTKSDTFRVADYLHSGATEWTVDAGSKIDTQLAKLTELGHFVLHSTSPKGTRRTYKCTVAYSEFDWAAYVDWCK